MTDLRRRGLWIDITNARVIMSAAVGRRLEHRGLPDDPARAGPVLRDELLPKQLGQPGRDEPCHEIVPAARTGCNDDATGLSGHFWA